MLLDGLTVAGLAYMVGALLTHYTDRRSVVGDDKYAILITLASLATPLVLQLLGAYRLDSAVHLRSSLRRCVLAWSAVVVGLLVLLVLFKASAYYSRAWLLLWSLSVAVGLIVFQTAWWALQRRRRLQGRGVHKVILIGDIEHAARLLADVAADPLRQFRIIGIFSDDEFVGGVRRLGSASDAVAGIHSRWSSEVDEVWILQSAANTELAASLHHSAELRLFGLRLVPDLQGFLLDRGRIETIASHVLLELSALGHQGVEGFLKEAMDRLGALVGLILLSPLMLSIACLIKWDSPGPILFRQKRHGLRGHVFLILKFRTLRPGLSSAEGKLKQVARGDARITRVGRVLRQWSLDELPQLFNVLKGDMSLVGPRPHEMGMNLDAAHQDVRYRQRHRMKPGMTGWAQVNGHRGPVATPAQMEERVDYDLWYIDNWSVWLDLRILLKTLLVGLRGENAY